MIFVKNTLKNLFKNSSHMKLFKNKNNITSSLTIPNLFYGNSFAINYNEDKDIDYNCDGQYGNILYPMIIMQNKNNNNNQKPINENKENLRNKRNIPLEVESQKSCLFFMVDFACSSAVVLKHLKNNNIGRLIKTLPIEQARYIPLKSNSMDCINILRHMQRSGGNIYISEREEEACTLYLYEHNINNDSFKEEVRTALSNVQNSMINIYLSYFV